MSSLCIKYIPKKFINWLNIIAETTEARDIESQYKSINQNKQHSAVLCRAWNLDQDYLDTNFPSKLRQFTFSMPKYIII